MPALSFPVRSAQFQASLWTEVTELCCRKEDPGGAAPPALQCLVPRTCSQAMTLLRNCPSLRFYCTDKICLVPLHLFNSPTLAQSRDVTAHGLFCDELPHLSVKVCKSARALQLAENKELFISKVPDPQADSSVCPGAKRHQISQRKY